MIKLTAKKIRRAALAAAVLLIAAVMALTASCAAGKPANEATQKPADGATEAPGKTDEPKATDVVTAAPTEAPTEEITAEPTEVVTQGPTAEPTAANIASGTNVALDAEVEVSSTTGASHVQWGWDYTYINDGIYYDPSVPSVGWTTAVFENPDDPLQEEWVILELDKYTSVNRIMIYPVVQGNFMPESFKVMVSLNGRDWTTVGEVEDNTRSDDRDDSPFEFTFDPVTVKYVQFLATKLYHQPSAADGYLCQLAEIEVYAA